MNEAPKSTRTDPNDAAAAAPDSVPDWSIAPSRADAGEPLFSALSLLAGMLDRPISPEALKAGLPRGTSSLAPELCVRAAERAGLSARIVRRKSIRRILPVTLPCILLLKGQGACVLTALVDQSRAEIVLPESGAGEKTIDIEELQKDYLGYAIFARPEFRFDDRAREVRLKDPKAWFWGTLARFWPIYVHVIVASVLINTFAIAMPLFIMTVYDRVVPNETVETLWVLAAGIGIVITFEFLIRNLRSYFVDVAGKNADIIIASRLLQHVMGMRLDQKSPSTGALANNLREFESLRDFFTSGTLVALVDLPFVLLFIAVIWALAGPLSYIPMGAVPVVILAGLVLQGPLRRVIEATYRETAQKHALLIEAIEGLETVKASAAEGRIQGDWERLVGMTAESSRKARAISTLSTTFTQIVIQLSTVGVVIYGVYLIKEGDLTVGGLVAATILTARALAPLGAVAAMLTRLQQSRVALKSLDDLMKAPVERPVGKSFVHRPRLNGQVGLKDVEFAYPGQAGKALDGVSFEVMAGEKVGIIGRVGSGKSTLARLIIGLYEPQSGSVRLDLTDNRQIDPADLRRNVGYVSQDNYLFFGSARENIAFGAPYADDEAILRAASIVGISEFIGAHPMGLDLPVGERGTGLSGGQRQGIAVARALLLNPPILLLDEPTSFMDHTSEARFMKNLGAILPGKTLLLITHRGSLLNLVDRLVVLDGGRIVANGPKDEVLVALKEGRVSSAGA